MKIVVYLLGLLLVAGGGASMWTGFDIVQVERGWTQVIAGAAALSGGVVTLAIGALIGAVNKLHGAVAMAGEDFLKRLREEPATARAEAREAEPLAPAAPAPEPAAAKPEIAMSKPERPNLPLSGAEAPQSFAPPSPPEPATGGARDRLPSVDDVGPALDWLRSGPARPAKSRNPPGGERETAPAPAVPETGGQLASTLRRFESGGINYTLFADGSILAESPDGREKFANMDALRKHLASRDQIA